MRKASLITFIITIVIIGLLLTQLPGAGPDMGAWMLMYLMMIIGTLGGVLSISFFVASIIQTKKTDTMQPQTSTMPSENTPSSPPSINPSATPVPREAPHSYPYRFVEFTNYLFLVLIFLLFIPVATRISPEIFVCLKRTAVETAQFNYCPVYEWFILIGIDLIFVVYLFIAGWFILKDLYKPIKFRTWFLIIIIPALGAIFRVLPFLSMGSYYFLGNYIPLGNGESLWGVDFPVGYLWSVVMIFLSITQFIVRIEHKPKIETEAQQQSAILDKPSLLTKIILILIIVAVLTLPLLYRANYIKEETSNLPIKGTDFNSYTFPGTKVTFNYPPTWKYEVTSDQEVRLTPKTPISGKVWATVKLEDAYGKKFYQYLENFQSSTGTIPQENSSVYDVEVERNDYKYAHLGDANGTTEYWLFIKDQKIVILSFPSSLNSDNPDEMDLLNDLSNITVNSLINP